MMKYQAQAILALLALSLLLSACPTQSQLCEEAALFPPSLQLGTGESNFELFVEDSVLSLVSGRQGGQHIWGALETTGLYPGDSDRLGWDGVELSWTLEFPEADSDYGPYSHPEQVFLAGSAESAEHLGSTVFICGWDAAYYHSGTDQARTIMSVTATDICGTSVSDSGSFLADISEWQEDP